MSKDNFQYWKELVGLENGDFPRLIPLTGDKIKQAVVVSTRFNPIMDSIAEHPFVDIQVKPGWGATTLFRYFRYELEQSKLKIIVSFDFEQEELTGTLSEDDFSFWIKRQMAEKICQKFWDDPWPKNYMYEVTNFEDNGSSPWRGHLRHLIRELEECEKSEKFYSLFPFFAEHPVDICIDYFLANFQIQTVFMFLFPSNVDENSIYQLVGIIKNLFDGKEIAPAAMREVYFCTRKVFKEINEYYERPYQTIIYSQYSAAEIFKMLISTYEMAESSQTVSDVLSEDFISKAYDKRSTLNSIMEKVEALIVDSLNVDTSQIPYKLESGINEEARIQ